MNALTRIFAGQAPQLTLLFFHGLTGDPRATWVSGTTEDNFWPSWLESDFPQIAAFTLGYPSSIFEKWAKKEMDIHERAVNILEELAANGIGVGPIAMICHSLGGILAKEVLRTASQSQDDDWRRIADSTKLVCFLATPHSGAALAGALRFIAPRLASKHVDLLSNEGGYLTSLNTAYRELAKRNDFNTVAYYERHKLSNVTLVVTRESADPGTGLTPVAVDADHSSICKPASKSELVYTSLCRHIRNTLKKCPIPNGNNEKGGAFGSDDYGERSGSDRRDLQQKLIDAGREHEYQKANELQNKFARRYYKHGLYASDREKSDALLALVEQRFITHVYAAQICKKQPHGEVEAAVQKHVIDALCVDAPERDRLNPTAVLQALYFLTEQCHIQWDAP